ncbi:MAG TPA: hypothetical protein VN905_03380 [Candidatus Binatia bacterium]|nr:hypothetical protein [Candidatus Binatia bacterium]
MADPGEQPVAETELERRARLIRLFQTPERLLEAVIAAEVLAPPLALRTTSTDRRTF